MVATLLEGGLDGAGSEPDERLSRYLSQFLAGVARSAGDDDLGHAARDLAAEGAPLRARLARVAALVQDRMGDRSAV